MIDLDPKITVLLDQHTPRINDEGDWSRVLRDADVTQPHGRPAHAWRRRATALVAAAAVVAAGSLTGISLIGGSSSILERARAAVTVTSGQVLHERIVFSPRSGRAVGQAEVWVQGAAPHQYRLVSHAYAPGRGVPAHSEQGGTLDTPIIGHRYAPTTDTYDARTNTINRLSFGPLRAGLPFDPATAIRDALASGKAHVDGNREIAGKRVIVIQLTSLASDGIGWGVKPGGTGTATVLVNTRTYTPIQIEFHHLSGASQLLGTPYFGGTLTLIERFQIFERIPGTAANLQLTSLSAQHPTAKCRINDTNQPCNP
jgi:hypothetical protein